MCMRVRQHHRVLMLSSTSTANVRASVLSLLFSPSNMLQVRPRHFRLSLPLRPSTVVKPFVFSCSLVLLFSSACCILILVVIAIVFVPVFAPIPSMPLAHCRLRHFHHSVSRTFVRTLVCSFVRVCPSSPRSHRRTDRLVMSAVLSCFLEGASSSSLYYYNTRASRRVSASLSRHPPAFGCDPGAFHLGVAPPSTFTFPNLSTGMKVGKLLQIWVANGTACIGVLA